MDRPRRWRPSLPARSARSGSPRLPVETTSHDLTPLSIARVVCGGKRQIRVTRDGLRIDVAHALAKDPDMPDLGDQWPPGAAEIGHPHWDRDEVHDVYRRWHDVLDSVGADRMAVAEAWTQTPESMAAFVRPDELDQAFNFAWLLADWSAEAFAKVITDTLAAVEPVGASPVAEADSS